MKHKNLNAFFELEGKEERLNFFRIRNEAELETIYSLLAEDDRLTATIVLELEDPYRAMLTHHIIGERGKGLNSLQRTITVEPTGKGRVIISRGTRKNKRDTFEITERTTLPLDIGLNALNKYGPESKLDCHRGCLVEVVEGENKPAKKPESGEQVFTLAQVEEILEKQRLQFEASLKKAKPETPETPDQSDKAPEESKDSEKAPEPAKEPKPKKPKK